MTRTFSNTPSCSRIGLIDRGFRRHLDGSAKLFEIIVFVWESDGKNHFFKLNFTQFVNRNDKILGRKLQNRRIAMQSLKKNCQNRIKES